jgi:predicted transcriptional regulator
MRTVRIGIAGFEDMVQDAETAFKGEYRGEYIGFISLELMHKVLTPNRWQMLQAMMGQGPMGIRELARVLDRDVKQVSTDVTALAKAGVINRTTTGAVEFPFDKIHVDFTVEAAARVA